MKAFAQNGPKNPGITLIFDRIETAPKSAINTRRGLTLQIDSTDWRATVMVPKICSFEDCHKPKRALGLCNAHRMQQRNNGVLKPLQKWDRSLPEEPRFWQKVDRRSPEECWEWQACINKTTGYGTVRSGARASAPAHRIAYGFTKGTIPAGAEIDHICHNRTCVNPSHLRAVSRRGNSENHSGPQSNNTSGYRGVSWKRDMEKWEARASSRGKTHIVGFFSTREEAAEAARLKRVELFTYNDIDRKVMN